MHATGANRILAFPHLSLFDMRYVLASMQMHKMMSYHDIIFSTTFKNGSTTANSDFRMHTEPDRMIEIVFTLVSKFMLKRYVLGLIMENRRGHKSRRPRVNQNQLRTAAEESMTFW